MGERAALAASLVGSILAGRNAVGVRDSNRELDPFRAPLCASRSPLRSSS